MGFRSRLRVRLVADPRWHRAGCLEASVGAMIDERDHFPEARPPHYHSRSPREAPVLTITRDMVLPTTVTGSYPRPQWFDRSLAGRSFKSALGDSLFREQYLDAVASIIAEQEAAGLDIVTDGDSRFD